MRPLSDYDFVNRVLSHVKFKYDHAEIAKELNDHIEDMADELMKSGIDESKAKEMAEGFMGDPDEIGEELNREHSAVLGWVWRISRIIVIALFIMLMPTFLNTGLLAANTALNVFEGYGENEAESVVKTDINGKIDDVYIFVDEVRLYDNGNIDVCYRTLHNPFGKSQIWSFSLNGCFKDELGNKYYGGGSSSAGFVSYNISRLENFSPEAKELIIDYDYNGRKLYGKILLRGDEAK